MPPNSFGGGEDGAFYASRGVIKNNKEKKYQNGD
jgi:hypothetical protein